MVNKLIIDGVNTELDEKSSMPYTYTFSQAKVHSVKIAIDSTDEICAEAFKDCPRLTKITFPDEITKIKRNAFENCTGLTSITIPPTIKYIGANAFEGCSYLTEIDFTGTTPPDVYCTFPEKCRCFVPDDSKYLVADLNEIEDLTTYTFYTKTFYGSYVEVSDPKKMTSASTYYYNNWDSINLTKKDVTVEYKDRTPIDEISFGYETVITVTANTQDTISYTLLPANETNHHLTWVSSNPKLCYGLGSITENSYIVKIGNIKEGFTSNVTLTAYSESGVWNSVRLRIVNGTLDPSTGEDTGGSGSGSDDSGSGSDDIVLVTSINISATGLGSENTIEINKAFSLNITVNPSDATNSEYTVTCSDKSINVTDITVISIPLAGEYTFTATAKDASRKSAQITVKVVNPESSESTTTE